MCRRCKYNRFFMFYTLWVYNIGTRSIYMYTRNGPFRMKNLGTRYCVLLYIIFAGKRIIILYFVTKFYGFYYFFFLCLSGFCCSYVDYYIDMYIRKIDQIHPQCSTLQYKYTFYTYIDYGKSYLDIYSIVFNIREQSC